MTANTVERRSAAGENIAAVGSATDTLARFVDLLADSLDDSSLTGEAVAARLHLSRFHCDRLIAATAGEPPGRLRRRILLERAAYRLLTSDDDLLEVALAAGYGSHTAFTRAFRRAYGDVPSRWRNGAHGFRIASPSAVHFHPPGGLRVSPQRGVTSMDVLTRMVEHHVWLVGELLTRAERLPDRTLDTPIESSVAGVDDDPTARSLLARLIGQLAMWNAVIAGAPYDLAAEREATIPALRSQLATAGPAFLERVRAVADERRLDDTFVDALCDPPEVFTYGGLIAHVLTFAAPRRLLVLGVLADAGVGDLGSGDPMLWVAEPA